MGSKTTEPRFFQSSLIYFCGSLLSKLALFFMLPLYTAHLPTGELGAFDAATAVAVLLSSFLFLDIGVGVMRFYLSRTSEAEGDTVLRAGLFLILASTLLYLFVTVVLCVAFHVTYASLLVLYGLCHALFSAGGSFARAKGYTVLYAMAGLLSTLLQVALNLFLILGLHLGIVSLYIAYAVGAGTGALLLFWRCRAHKLLRFTKEVRAMARRIFRFCLPLGAGAAAFWVLNSANRVLVNHFVDNEAGGIYTVSLRFAQIVIFVATCFQFAWQELSFARGYGKGEAPHDGAYYTAKLDLLARVAIAATLCLIPAARVGLWLLPGFIAPAYGEAITFIPLALCGAMLAVFAGFLEPIFGALQKTGCLLLTTTVGAIFNLAVSTVLMKNGFGAWGAHLGFIFAFSITVILRLFILYRLLHVTLRWRFILALPAIAFAAAAFYSFPPAVNIAVLCGMLFLSALLLLPELQLLFRRCALLFLHKQDRRG